VVVAAVQAILIGAVSVVFDAQLLLIEGLPTGETTGWTTTGCCAVVGIVVNSTAALEYAVKYVE
jgi:hypothetical protein